jgi:hypothetical protein
MNNVMEVAFIGLSTLASVAAILDFWVQRKAAAHSRMVATLESLWAEHTAKGGKCSYVRNARNEPIGIRLEATIAPMRL